MSVEIKISEAEIDELKAAIASASAQGVVAAGSKETFCEIWPSAKQALTLLVGLLALVPGVGPFAKVAIGVVIAAGDAAHSALCG